jgi:hypothetical protein
VKYISYSIFGYYNPELQWYIRGLVFNCAMNRLIYPNWKTIVYAEASLASEYYKLFERLHAEVVLAEGDNLCRSMLWRMKAIFKEDAEYVICRDADALTTYREAQMVAEFINSGLTVHGITDNPAHSQPLMGGMCGFKTAPLVERYGSWDNLIKQSKIKISERGSDQVFLAQELYPFYKSQMFAHYLKGMKNQGEAVVKSEVSNVPIPDVNPNLWTSNLCIPFIGSAGVIEFETIRFFRSYYPPFDKECEELAKHYPKIFYWQ